MLIDEGRFYTLQEISDMTGMCIRTVRRKMDEGKIKRVTAPREKVRFSGKDIKEWLSPK